MADTKHTRIATSHIAPFGVRMQPELKERLEHSAQQAGRSLNAEIVGRLESSFTSGPGDSILMSTVARLNLNLAAAEFRKYSLEAEAHSFALLVQRAAALLLDRLEQSDEETHKIIRELAIQAQPYIRDIANLDEGLSERVTKVREATQQMNKALHSMMTNVGLTPDLAVMRPDGTLTIMEAKAPAPKSDQQTEEVAQKTPTRRVSAKRARERAADSTALSKKS